MKRLSAHCCVLMLFACGAFTISADDFDSTTAAVSRQPNGIITPVNQIVTPAGVTVQLPGVRPNALALSPNGKLLVTSGLRQELLVLDPVTGKVLQKVDLPSDTAGPEAPVSPEILEPNEK